LYQSSPCIRISANYRCFVASIIAGARHKDLNSRLCVAHVRGRSVLAFLSALKISGRRIPRERSERNVSRFAIEEKNKQEKKEEAAGKEARGSLLVLASVMERATDDAIKRIATIRSCIIDVFARCRSAHSGGFNGPFFVTKNCNCRSRRNGRQRERVSAAAINYDPPGGSRRSQMRGVNVRSRSSK